MSNITVKLGKLAQPLRPTQCASGTTLEQFLKRRDMEYNASMRVNGNVVAKTHVLHAGEIITVIGNVSGGF